VRRIRFTASTSVDPAAVYAAARLDVPEKPGPKRETPVPEAPSKLTITLDTQGRAVVSFIASREGGAAFEVQRQVVTLGTPSASAAARTGKRAGPWELAGTTLTRPFVDEATPSGVAGVFYRVRACRPGASSDWSAPVGLPMGVEARVA
jgi:hypothetical protein